MYHLTLVLIWALSAIVSKETDNQDILDQTKMFVAALLSISCVLLLLRLILVIVRQKRQPIGQEESSSDDQRRRSSTTYGSIF